VCVCVVLRSCKGNTVRYLNVSSSHFVCHYVQVKPIYFCVCFCGDSFFVFVVCTIDLCVFRQGLNLFFDLLCWCVVLLLYSKWGKQH